MVFSPAPNSHLIQFWMECGTAEAPGAARTTACTDVRLLSLSPSLCQLSPDTHQPQCRLQRRMLLHTGSCGSFDGTDGSKPQHSCSLHRKVCMSGLNFYRFPWIRIRTKLVRTPGPQGRMPACDSLPPTHTIPTCSFLLHARDGVVSRHAAPRPPPHTPPPTDDHQLPSPSLFPGRGTFLINALKHQSFATSLPSMLCDSQGRWGSTPQVEK